MNTKWMGWPLFHACHAHFSKWLLFQKWPLKITKVEISKKICIFSNHFIGIFNCILHALILIVVPEKLKRTLLLLNFIRTGLYLLRLRQRKRSLLKIAFLCLLSSFCSERENIIDCFESLSLLSSFVFRRVP